MVNDVTGSSCASENYITLTLLHHPARSVDNNGGALECKSMLRISPQAERVAVPGHQASSHTAPGFVFEQVGGRVNVTVAQWLLLNEKRKGVRWEHFFCIKPYI